MGNATASAGAAGPFYRTTGRRKQQVAAAELSVLQDLSKDYGPTWPGAADAAVDSAGAAVPFEELRAGTDPPDGYAGVHRGKRTTRPRDRGPMSQSDARDFGPKLLHADRQTGLGQGSQMTSNSF